MILMVAKRIQLNKMNLFVKYFYNKFTRFSIKYFTYIVNFNSQNVFKLNNFKSYQNIQYECTIHF